MGKRTLFIGIDQKYKWEIIEEKYVGVSADKPAGDCPDDLLGFFGDLMIDKNKLIYALSLDKKYLDRPEIFKKHSFYNEQVNFKVGFFKDNYKVSEEFSGTVADGFKYILDRFIE
ncbi:MAG: hypothetical protein RBR53_03030 [Desulforegulaceae bacterium]|nr:hypothetical protein [Desulforegulaceae bacterium]